jgi:hypothetical protein
MNMNTYNKYLTEGQLDGSIEERTEQGVNILRVRAPFKHEPVDGYTNFSSIFGEETITQQAGRLGHASNKSDE